MLTVCYNEMSETADRRPQTADRRPQTADRRPQTADRRPQTADRISLLTAGSSAVISSYLYSKYKHLSLSV